MEVREPSAKYVASAGRKSTELGELPADWQVLRLGDVASVSSGGTPSRAVACYWTGNIPWVTTAQVDFCTIREAEQYISAEGLAASAAKLLKPGTLLMALYGQGKTRGKVAVLGIEATTNQACAAISVESGVSANYAFVFLGSRYEAIRKLSNTGNQENLSGALVKNLLIAVPSEREQSAITEAIGDADALIESLEQLLAKKRRIKQGAMQELLTGKRRLPGFHGHWERRALAEVVIDLVAGVSVNSTDDEPVAGTPCVLKTSALSGGSLLSHECKPITPADYPRARTSLRGNTILISRMNTPDLVGEISYVPEDIPWIFLPDRVWMARLDPSVNARWLANVLTNSACRQRVRDAATGTSGSMKNISKGALLALEIPFPSLAEQTAIATLLSDLDAELEALESQLAKARDLKQGMMQALLTGRIRLV